MLTAQETIYPSLAAAKAAIEKELTTMDEREPLTREEGGMPLFILTVETTPAGEVETCGKRYDVAHWWPETTRAIIFQETKEGKRSVFTGMTIVEDWEYGYYKDPLPYDEVLRNLDYEKSISARQLATEIAHSVGYGGGYIYPGDFWVIEGGENTPHGLQQVIHGVNDYRRPDPKRDARRVSHNEAVLNNMPEGTILGCHRVMSSDEDHNGLRRIYVKSSDGDGWDVYF